MLCIFTPTYNRAYTLTRLYNSLKNQTCQRFEWFVVDDGSTDNTEELINGFKDEHFLKIKYVKVQNGGKQRAHNFAVSNCGAELFLCVDSDDYLVYDAVEQLLKKWESVKNQKDIAGIIFLKGYSSDVPLNGELPIGIEKIHLRSLYRKYRFKGDVGLAYKTEVLLHHPFYIAPNEKFIGENYSYDQIDQEYMMGICNKVLYIAEYLPDGYTKNIRKITKENPLSYMELKRQSFMYDEKLIEKFADITLFLVGGMLAKQNDLIKESPNKLMAIISYLPASLIKALFFK